MSDATLKRRILDISYKHRLSHLGSVLSALPIIAGIYRDCPDDTFVLSSGHAGLALYVVLEAVYGLDAEVLLSSYGIHPGRGPHIPVASGSLGHGLPVCCGLALASPTQKFHCLISDGESYEGSIWEALRFIKERPLSNLRVYVNANGYSAYKAVDVQLLERLLEPFEFVKVVRFPGCSLGDHYRVLDREAYEKAICGLDA